MKILRRKTLVTLDIFYYLPDYPSLIEEFIWQTHDVVPELPRVQKFLWYWHDNVDATINKIYISHEKDA